MDGDTVVRDQRLVMVKMEVIENTGGRKKTVTELIGLVSATLAQQQSELRSDWQAEARPTLDKWSETFPHHVVLWRLGVS